jgi:hypothetical protein
VRQDPVRDEAERLVAAAVAAVSMAARTIPRSGPHAVATGSDDCCVCPLCRVISVMREPSAEFTERLATGAGDLATAVAGVLRTLARGGHRDEPEPPSEADEFWETMRRRAADAARSAAQEVRRPAPDDPWHQATTAAADVDGPDPAGSTRAVAARPVAKKAVAKKTVAKKTVAKKAVVKKAVAKKAPSAAPEPAKQATAQKAVAKKAVAKKAVAKAVKKAAPPAAGQESD